MSISAADIAAAMPRIDEVGPFMAWFEALGVYDSWAEEGEVKTGEVRGEELGGC